MFIEKNAFEIKNKAFNLRLTEKQRNALDKMASDRCLTLTQLVLLLLEIEYTEKNILKDIEIKKELK